MLKINKKYFNQLNIHSVKEMCEYYLPHVWMGRMAYMDKLSFTVWARSFYR